MTLQETSKDKGFTLIELLIVVSLTLLATAISVPLYSNLQNSVQLNDVESIIVQNVRIAKNRARSGFHDRSHGVYFKIIPGQKDSIVLYQGESYLTREAEFDREYLLHRSIDLTTDIVDSDLNFIKNSGEVRNFGEIILSHSSYDTRTISINNLGYVE